MRRIHIIRVSDLIWPNRMDGFNNDIFGVGAPDLRLSVNMVISTINWKDVGIICLVVYHILVFMLAMILREHKVGRLIIFVLCFAFSFASNKLEPYMAKNYQLIGFSRNYFDENHIFTLIMFVVPPMVTGIFLVSSIMGHVGGRYYEDRFQVKQPRKQPKKQEGKVETAEAHEKDE